MINQFRGRNKNFPNRQAARKMGAEIRAEEYAKLSVAEKIERLDALLGKDQGAEKQRARLNAQLEQEAQAKTNEATVAERKRQKKTAKKETAAE